VDVFRRSFMSGLGIAIAVFGTGCAREGPVACAPIPLPPSPFVQQLYPVPGSSGVADNLGLLVYASTESVPIQLVTGMTVVPTIPVVTPAVLPSPRATPAIPGLQNFAVSVPPLQAATLYTTQSTLTFSDTCAPPRRGEQSIATFSTR